jgi:carboxylesterase
MSVAFRINLRKNISAVSVSSDTVGDKLYLEGNNGSLMLLIHGLTGTPHEMRFLAYSLNREGYTVICPRLKNHGQPLVLLQNTKWQEFYLTVKEAFLGVKNNYQQVFVSGLSMGALLALLLAEEFPAGVRGVSCLSPTLFYDGWNTPWYRCFLPLVYLTPLKSCFYFKEDPPYGIKNEAVRRKIHKYYSQASLDDIDNVGQYGYPYFPVTLLYQLELLVRHLNRRLKNITTPVQLIQARDDDMTSVKNSQFIYNRIASQNKEMVLLEDSYHVITADQQRERVAEEMARFFGGLRRA